MNKDTVFARFEKKISGMFNNLKNTAHEYDIESFPALLVFLIVTMLGMVMTFFGMRVVFGDLAAALIAGLFECGIVAWKMQSARIKNNEYQNSLTNTATWISVCLAFLMLVVNLFRVSLEKNQVNIVGNVNLNGWETAAYIIIGLAALTHIVCYLLFDQNDTEKDNKRKNANAEIKLNQRDREADNTLANLETDTKILRKIIFKLSEIHKANIDLPIEQLEPLLEKYRLELLKAYGASEAVADATKGEADINKDGKIGANTFMMRPAYGAQSEQPQLQPNRNGADKSDFTQAGK